MLEFFRDFFLHKDAFTGYVRGGVMSIGVLGLTGLPKSAGEWGWVALIFFGGMIRAGDKNEVA